MSVEVVASGIKGGEFWSNGSATGAGSAAAGTGAGAAGLALESLALVFFFLGFLPPDIMEPMPPWQQQHKQMRTIHSQIGNCEPQEPEAVEPEDPEDPPLADPEESLAHDPWLNDPEE